MSELSLTTTRQINAPVEKVFNAWLSPDTLKRFMLPGEDMHVPKAEVDAKVGGRFAIVMASGKDEIPHAGTYLTIDPHSKIVFTWESPFSVEDSTVTLDMRPLDAGKTELTLTHVRFANADSRDGHQKGWEQILAALAAAEL